MSALTPESLYALLPAVHRIRDAAKGSPLEALLRIAATQGGIVEDDVTRLLDNWFIETCDEWLVPYIGDLLGVRGLHSVSSDAAFSQRARVANTLGYRRRKGTATMLEQLARDTTGWPARAVEFFQILGWNQHYNHNRPRALRTPDLRDTNQLELLGTAFDTATHTVDVRRIALDRGRHNIPNIGLFLWRLQSYHLEGVDPRPTGVTGFFTFNPLGQDRPLFNRPQTETEVTHLAEEINVPAILRRRPLYDELEARRAALAAGATPDTAWFDTSPVLAVHQQPTAGDPFTEVPREKIRICHLGPGASRPAPGGTAGNPDILVGVDPVLGRIAWADTLTPPNALKVDFAHGFSGDLGGGPYNRDDSLEVVLRQRETPKLGIDWHVGVGKETDAVGTETLFTTLSDAIVEWHAQPAGTVGIISILDSRTYDEDLTIEIPEGSQLLIAGARWPALPVRGGAPGETRRVPGQLDAAEVRPHLLGNLTVVGTAPDDSESPGTLAVDGLLVEGAVTVDVKTSPKRGNLGLLRIAHSTLMPAAGGLTVTGRNTSLTVQLFRSICGPISLANTVPTLDIDDCIVDAGNAAAIVAGESVADVQNTTVFGTTNVRQLSAGNSIFTAVVKATRRQEGCIRFCWLPTASLTSRRYRCQPEFALLQARKEATDAGTLLDPTEEAALLARVVPLFTARDYGHPAYAQLARACAQEIRAGAEDGAEMGAFRFLQQPQREANLRSSLDEFLRFGLEAGLIFAT